MIVKDVKSVMILIRLMEIDALKHVKMDFLIKMESACIAKKIVYLAQIKNA